MSRSQFGKVQVKIVVIWLFALFCLGLFFRFSAKPSAESSPDVIQVAERMAVVAKYSTNLPPDAREQLQESALQIEENPAARDVIKGKVPKDSSKLSKVYKLMLEELEKPSAQTRAQLVEIASHGEQRFALTITILCGLFLVSLLSLFGPKVEETAPVTAPTHFSPMGVLGLFLAWDVIGFFLLGSAMAIVSGAIKGFALILLGQMTLYLLLLFMLKKAGLRESWRPFPRFSTGWLGKGYLAALVTVFVVNVLVAIISGDSPKSENPVLSLFAGAPGWKIALLGLLVVVIGPFFEEILFRGWLYGGLRDTWGDGPALVVSSALFALIHGDAPGLLPLFCLGLVFGMVYRRSGSLIASILVHSFWNATTFAILISVMP